jgi:hypothetical protein
MTFVTSWPTVRLPSESLHETPGGRCSPETMSFVEPARIELATSCMPCKRSPN